MKTHNTRDSSKEALTLMIATGKFKNDTEVVIEYLRRYGPASRKRIAKDCNLVHSNMGQYCKGPLKSNLIHELKDRRPCSLSKNRKGVIYLAYGPSPEKSFQKELFSNQHIKNTYSQ